MLRTFLFLGYTVDGFWLEGLFFVFGLFQIFKKSWHLFLDILGKGFHIAIVSCDLHLGRTVSVFDVLLVVDPKLSVHGCIDQLFGTLG